MYVADNFISLYTVFIFQNVMEKYSQSETPDNEERYFPQETWDLILKFIESKQITKWHKSVKNCNPSCKLMIQGINAHWDENRNKRIY